MVGLSRVTGSVHNGHYFDPVTSACIHESLVANY